MPVVEIEKGKKYRAKFYYRDEDGNSKYGGSKTFIKKRDATSWLQAQKDKFNKNGAVKNADLPFVDFWMKWFELFKKPSLRPVTADKWMNSYSVISKYWQRTSLKNIDRTSYQEFINWYGANHAKSSAEKVHVHMHAAVKYAVEENYIDRDFALRPTLSGAKGKPDALKYLQEADFFKLIKYLNSTNNELNVSRAMIQFACYTGARLSEIAGLTIEDVDLKTGIININKTYNYRDGGFAPTKNPQSIRRIDIDDHYLQILKKRVLTHELRKQELLFAKNNSTTPPTSNAVNKELRKIFKDIGINSDMNFHGLRHTHISYLLANEVNIQYVSKRAGHSSVSTTLNVYTHILERLEHDEISRTKKLLSAIG